MILKQALLDICNGVGPEGFPKLPKPGMLMLDRVTKIDHSGGTFGSGIIQAEYDIAPSAWFFKSHFADDPIMPGSLGIDGLCQLLGFFLGDQGHRGQGRALGIGKVRYKAEIRPETEVITYKVNIRSVKSRHFVYAIADGTICNGSTIFTYASGITVGIRPTEP